MVNWRLAELLHSKFVTDNATCSWRPVVSDVPQGSILGPVLLNILISDLDDGSECTLSEFAEDTQLWVVVLLWRGNSTGWRNGEGVQFSNGKYQVLPLERNNHWHRPGQPAGKHLCREGQILVYTKLDMRYQCALAGKKANSVPHCMSQSVASQLRKVILPLYSALVRHNWSAKSNAELFSTKKMGMYLLVQAHWRAMKNIWGLEHLSYENRLRDGTAQPGERRLIHVYKY